MFLVNNLSFLIFGKEIIEDNNRNMVKVIIVCLLCFLAVAPDRDWETSDSKPF